MRGGAARAVTSQRIPRLQPNDPRRRTPTTPAGHASRGGDMRTRTRSPMPLFGPPLAAEHREGCMQTCTSPGHNRQLLTGGRQTQTDEATPETGSNRRHASRRRLPLSRAQHEYRGFRIALPTSRTDAVVGGATEGVRERPGAPGHADRSAVWATAGASCGASLQPPPPPAPGQGPKPRRKRAAAQRPRRAQVRVPVRQPRSAQKARGITNRFRSQSSGCHRTRGRHTPWRFWRYTRAP